MVVSSSAYASWVRRRAQLSSARRWNSASTPRASSAACQFDYVGDPRNVVIDLTGADIWDASTVARLDATRHKYAAKGTHVEIVGLDGAGLDRLSGRLGDGH